MEDITEYNLVILLPINSSFIYRQIENWNIDEVLKLKIHDLYGFRFEHRRKTIEKDAEKGRLDINIEKIKVSGTYYINCYIETIEDLLVKPRKDNFLLKQMQVRGIKRVVRTIDDDLIFPFLDGDVVIDKRGKLVEC